HLPLDLEGAMRALANGEVRRVDIATANGRTFVHQFGVGIHARLVRIREGMTYGSRAGKMFASLRAIGAAAVKPPRFEVELESDGNIVKRIVSGVVVFDSRVDDGINPEAERLEGDLLGVYLVGSMPTPE